MIIIRLLPFLLLLTLYGCGGQLQVQPPGEEDDGEVPEGVKALSLSGLQRLYPRLPPVPVIMTDEVLRQKRSLLRGRGRTITEALQRSEPYRREMIRIFNREGVPLDLLNIPIIESGFKSSARGPMGSKGIWQFSKTTARAYGLSVGLFTDQRKDPLLATKAAAEHLRDLYHRYEDWYVSLAAYNAGVGRVNQAIRRAGSRNFWDLAEGGYLPRYTREYIPKFLAATIIVREIQREMREANGASGWTGS